MVRRSVALALVLGLTTPASGHHLIGTDLAALNFCMYGDCEARGTYAADPFGVYNPAVMVVGAAQHLPHGAALSGSYYNVGIGAVDGQPGAFAAMGERW